VLEPDELQAVLEEAAVEIGQVDELSSRAIPQAPFEAEVGDDRRGSWSPRPE
jgi:hypothetical protein